MSLALFRFIFLRGLIHSDVGGDAHSFSESDANETVFFILLLDCLVVGHGHNFWSVLENVWIYVDGIGGAGVDV